VINAMLPRIFASLYLDQMALLYIQSFCTGATVVGCIFSGYWLDRQMCCVHPEPTKKYRRTAVTFAAMAALLALAIASGALHDHEK
jgi:hypothetical protein